MELRDYIKILRENISFIVATTLIFVLAVYAWSIKESLKYSAQMLLDIERVATQNTSDYHYDQFYRVSADEKFSQTVEQWLKFPGVDAEIFDKAGLNKNNATLSELAKSISVERVSPESISVKYSVGNEDDARKIADGIGKTIDEKTSSLNEQNNDPYWFKIAAADFIVAKNTQDLRINLGLACLAGIIIGSFLSLLKHYISEEKS